MLKAGNWRARGRVYVVADVYGNTNYWMYTSFFLDFAVVDNVSPITLQNLSVGSNINYHPCLTWNTNFEADVRANTNDGYLIERRIHSNTGTWSAWTQIASKSGVDNTYTDMEINNASGAGPGIAEYKMRAKDINGNTSGYSSTVSIGFGISVEKKQIEYSVYTNFLEQNYPNPFNPTTSITYSLEKPSYVSLIVYDILGNEVVELINETQEKGYHTVNFNASNLSSGIYFCKINAGKYNEIKKMQLIK